jgi:hypothetical protein
VTSIDDAATAAQTAAEAIRTLNHLTLSGTGYSSPGDVYAVLVELQTLAERLPQALSQAQEWLYREAEAGRVYDDRARNGQGPSPLRTVERAAAEMTAASVHLSRWTAATGRATGHLSHLGGR